MSGKWKQILLMGLVTVLVMLVGTVGLMYVNYPTSEHLAIEQAYMDAMGDDDETEMNRLDGTAQMQYVSRYAGVSLLLSVVLWAAVTYGVYAYTRKNRLSAKQAVGLTALVVTVASVVATPLAAMAHHWLIGASSPDVNLGGLLLSAPLVLIISFVVASIIEYVYKRRNSFEV